MEKKSGVLSGKHTMDLKLSPDMKDFLYSLDKYAGINFEDVMVKQAFLGGVLRGVGALGKEVGTLGKKALRTGKALVRKVEKKVPAVKRGIQAHVEGAKTFVKKNLQAGFEGNSRKPGISYGKAVSTERRAITRRANQTALQTAANERKASLPKYRVARRVRNSYTNIS